MTDSIADDFYTKKHLRLTRIAYIAKIFAWIALVVQGVWMVVHFIQAMNGYIPQAMYNSFIEELNFRTMWKHDTAFAALLLTESVGIFFRGVVYWLVLKGISLGLYMIVETDLNYKESAEGESNEQ